MCSGGVPAGPGPDVDSNHCWSSSSCSGADRPHCVSNRQEEEPCRVPDHLRGRFIFLKPYRLSVERGKKKKRASKKWKRLSEWKLFSACLLDIIIPFDFLRE